MHHSLPNSHATNLPTKTPIFFSRFRGLTSTHKPHVFVDSLTTWIPGYLGGISTNPRSKTIEISIPMDFPNKLKDMALEGCLLGKSFGSFEARTKRDVAPWHIFSGDPYAAKLHSKRSKLTFSSCGFLSAQKTGVSKLSHLKKSTCVFCNATKQTLNFKLEVY